MREINGLEVHRKVCNDFYDSEYKTIGDFVLNELNLTYDAYSRMMRLGGTMKKSNLDKLKKYL